MANPFIFSNQASQIFFLDVVDKYGWKVVLRKEARAKSEVVDHMDAFITTMTKSTGLIAIGMCPIPPNALNIVGVIELSKKDNLLVQVQY